MSVYFVSARELDLVKIGYAFDPVRRFKTLVRAERGYSALPETS